MTDMALAGVTAPPRVFAARAPLFWSLAERLSERGIPTIPLSEVNTHKRATVAAFRHGHLAWLVPLVDAIMYVLGTLNGWTLFYLHWLITRREAEKDSSTIGQAFYLSLAGVLLSIGFFMSGHPQLGGICLIPMGASLLIAVLFATICLTGNERAFSATWRRTPLALVDYTTGGPLPRMPAHLDDRCKRVLADPTLKNPRVYVDHFDKDPFPMLVAGPWWNRQLACIGAWSTGTSMDER